MKSLFLLFNLFYRFVLFIYLLLFVIHNYLGGGMEFLAKSFHLCQSPTSFNVNDLINWLSDTWSFLAMTNYPYPTKFLVPLPAYPINVC